MDRGGTSLQIVGTMFRLHAVDRYNFLPRLICYHSYNACSNPTFCLSPTRNYLLYRSYTRGTKGGYGLSTKTLFTLQRVYLMRSGGVFNFHVSINDLTGLSATTRRCTLARLSGPLGDCTFLESILPWPFRVSLVWKVAVRADCLGALRLSGVVTQTTRNYIYGRSHRGLLTVRPRYSPSRIQCTLRRASTVGSLLVGGNSPHFNKMRNIDRLTTHTIGNNILSVNRLLVITNTLHGFRGLID